ncbi:expressed unknown protein [Seminavis robusta]|uniref:Uncharacterized protein n=1 Tax=Seminavis robusta TaxID=568900 RepID=A0A9N8HF09_9STRA|nr:expressed unknown protein [Seminavis robusta]|eukprot:Sro501_g155440.1 n/a (114) ;mRNA; r:25225-25775
MSFEVPHRMRFDLMASHLATFPFVTHYNFSALEAQEQQQAQQQEQQQQQQQTQNRTFREQFLLDSIRGLQIRQQVEPSLVNHIGYYSERMLVTENGRFSQLNTDVRFMLDAGT